MEGDNLTSESKNSHFGLIVVLLITLGVILFVFTKKDIQNNNQEQTTPTLDQVKSVLLKDAPVLVARDEALETIDISSLPQELRVVIDSSAKNISIKKSTSENVYILNFDIEQGLPEYHISTISKLTSAGLEIKKSIRAEEFGYIDVEGDLYVLRINETQMLGGAVGISIEVQYK